jgi:hypothetical protein
VKATALALVGAENQIVLRPPNKKGISKRLQINVLPDPSDGRRTNQSGIILYSPNWMAAPGHEDNIKFIRALTDTVHRQPVSHPSLCQLY